MSARRFHLVNLGCAKNLVEGEHLAGALMALGWGPAPAPGQASALVVNTCGFIQPAVEEAVEAVLDLAAQKRPGQVLAVVGCLVGRYGKKLARSLPEADLLVSPGALAELPALLDQALGRGLSDRLVISPARGIFGLGDPRALTTGPGWAYLRVSDGCTHRCAYCTIPAIRGRLRSRPLDDVLAEAGMLANIGAAELNLIAQDLTSYGMDLGYDQGLAKLLEGLNDLSGLQWVRMLYLHPETLDASLIRFAARLDKIQPYFDIPVQHVAGPVIRAMGRQKYGDDLRALIETIRQEAPGATLRTTIMLGHPGEGQKEFDELMEFVAWARFDHLGSFCFQPEPGTRSARLERPGPETAARREAQLMELQRAISQEKLAAMKGGEQDILVLGPHPESDLLWHGRLACQAPDVDGSTIITSGNAEPGSIVPCRITKTHQYDLEAELLVS